MRRAAAGSLAHHGMLLACLGMLGGLALDASQGGITLLINLCSSSEAFGLDQITRLHWICLPYMHVGTLIGSLMPALFTKQPRKLLPGLTCAAWMIMGMNVGSYLLPHAAFGLDETYNITVLLAGMMGGMGASMVVWAFLARRNATGPEPTRTPQQSHKKALSVT